MNNITSSSVLFRLSSSSAEEKLIEVEQSSQLHRVDQFMRPPIILLLFSFLILLLGACTSIESSTPAVIDEADDLTAETGASVDLGEVTEFPTVTPVIEITLTPAPTAPLVVDKFTCRMVESIPESECEALLSIFSATNGDGWGDQYPRLGRPWMRSIDPCDWHGVFCRNGHVFEIDLRESQLTGALPPEIVQLTRLDTLNVSRNRLQGPLPIELGQMTWLRSADLSNNKFKSDIPPEYGNMLGLEALNLNYNNLTGEIPVEFGELPRNGKLNWLDLSFNPYLDGPIPDPIEELDYFSPEGTSLRRLHE